MTRKMMKIVGPLKMEQMKVKLIMSDANSVLSKINCADYARV